MSTSFKRQAPFVNREISWLFFNERVLQEAADQSVPLLERLRFLAIFSSNLDEFYRVRVATLNRLVNVNTKAKELLGFNPRKILHEIKNIVVKQEKRFEYLYENIIMKELANERIFIINETQLNVERGAFVRQYFHEKVLPDLVPIMLDGYTNKVFPALRDRGIYFIIKLTDKKKIKFALLEIPTKSVARFLVLPHTNNLKFIILLDDIIRYCLDDLFFIFKYEHIEAYSIQLTRDAELDIDMNVSEKFIDSLAKSLQKRSKGKPMRLLYDSEIPLDILNFLVSGMDLHNSALIPGNRYHSFRDFIDFPNIGGAHLSYRSLRPLAVQGLDLGTSIFSQVAKRDYLISLPYQSFDYIIHFLREAAIDPKVVAIHITLYRLAQNSKIIHALIHAAKNGKQVNCLVEVKARFDEEANIYWSNKLQESGVHVNYGILAYKVHSKICLISRKEQGRMAYYANLATGNYNERSAQSYCDHSVFTVHKGIIADLKRLFKGLEKGSFYKNYRYLITSPLEMRNRIDELIDTEILHAKEGKSAYLILKMNNLSDEGLILKLYEASNAGVKIQLIIRGMCCLVPKQVGYSENITVISIVDRFLEHARVWIFGNQGDELIYLSSADWMTRNIDRRLEVAFPILDPQIRAEIRDLMNIQLRDNVKARQINVHNDNKYVRKPKHKPPYNAQLETYNYLKVK